MSEDGSLTKFIRDIFYSEDRAVKRFRGCVGIFIFAVVYWKFIATFIFVQHQSYLVAFALMLSIFLGEIQM